MNIKKTIAGIGTGMLVLAGVALANNWTTPAIPIGTATVTATVFLNTETPLALGPLANLPFGLYVTTAAQQNTNAQPVVVGFDVSADNITWTTTAPIRVTNTCFGTTNVTTWTPLTADQTRGVQYIRHGYSSVVSATPVTIVGAQLGGFY